MKKIIYRFLSYAIDIIIVSIIILAISMIDFINPYAKNVSDTYTKYYEVNNKISSFDKELDKFLEDSVISDKEYDIIGSKYYMYINVFDNIKLNEDLKNKDIEKLREEIKEKNAELVNYYGYKINKYNTPQVIISLVVYILYFGVMQYFMNGQTIGKRIFRLKVVNNKNIKKKVGLMNYLIRSILITEIIFSVLDIIFLFSLNMNSYISSSYYVSQGKNFYEMIFMLCMVLRDDQRSIHDFILNTRVIRYDKSNKEIVEKLFNDEEDKKKTKKEFVGAEKVND